MEKIIKKGSLSNINLRELISYRHFIFNQFWRNINVIYKQTAFGSVYRILIPIIQSGLFAVIFSGIAKLPTDGIPTFLFYFSSMINWTLFQSCVVKNSDSFASYGHFIRNTYVPKLCFSISIFLENLFIYLINFLVLIIVFLIFYFNGVNINFNFKILIFYPIVLIYLSIFGTSIGLISAYLSVKFRDLRFVVSNLMQIFFFATPIVYSFNVIPEKYHLFFYLNPIVYPIDYFKNLFFSVSSVDITYLISSIIIFLILLFLVYILNKKISGTIADNV